MTIFISTKLLLATAILASLILQWHKQTRLPIRLVWESDGDWLVTLPAGTPVYAENLPGAYVSRYLIIVRLRLRTGKIMSLVLLPDMLGRDEMRHLRVRLRHFTDQLAE